MRRAEVPSERGCFGVFTENVLPSMAVSLGLPVAAERRSGALGRAVGSPWGTQGCSGGRCSDGTGQTRVRERGDVCWAPAPGAAPASEGDTRWLQGEAQAWGQAARRRQHRVLVTGVRTHRVRVRAPSGWLSVTPPLRDTRRPRPRGPGVQCPRRILWVQLPPPGDKAGALLSPLPPGRQPHSPPGRGRARSAVTAHQDTDLSRLRAHTRQSPREPRGPGIRRGTVRATWRQQSWPRLPLRSAPLCRCDCVRSLQPPPGRSPRRCVCRSRGVVGLCTAVLAVSRLAPPPGRVRLPVTQAGRTLLRPQGRRGPSWGLATPGLNFPRGGGRLPAPQWEAPAVGGAHLQGLWGPGSGCPHQPPAPGGGSAPVRTGSGSLRFLACGAEGGGDRAQGHRGPQKDKAGRTLPRSLGGTWPCDPSTSDARSPGLGGDTFLVFEPQLRGRSRAWTQCGPRAAHSGASRPRERGAPSGAAPTAASRRHCPSGALGSCGKLPKRNRKLPTTSCRAPHLACYSDLSPPRRTCCTRWASPSGSRGRRTGRTGPA